MTTKYNFMQEKEPSDQQLAEIMHEVAIEAKFKADAAQAKFKADLHSKVLAAKEELKKYKVSFNV